MSIKVMTYVWEHSHHKGSELLTLLAIADCAHDDGTQAYPSIAHLAKKTRLTERNVQLILKKLEASEELAIARNMGANGTNLFTVNLSPSRAGGVKSFRGGEKSSKKGVKSSALLQPQISPKPSLDPSEEEPSKIPPIPPRGNRRTAKGTTVKSAAIQTDADQVLAHLNDKTGRRYRNCQFIASRLHDGETVEDCTLVIDWWASVKVPQSPEQDRYFDIETPFRRSKFDKYLAAARAWESHGRTVSNGTSGLLLGEDLERATQALLDQQEHSHATS